MANVSVPPSAAVWPHWLGSLASCSAQLQFLFDNSLIGCGAAGAFAAAVKRLSVLLIGNLDGSPENVSNLLDGFAQLNKDLLRYKLAVQDATVAR